MSDPITDLILGTTTSPNRHGTGRAEGAPQGQENVFRWATVTTPSGPGFAIKLDGDVAPLPSGAVISLQAGVSWNLNDRVWCQMYGRRVLILSTKASAGGAGPQGPQGAQGAGTQGSQGAQGSQGTPGAQGSQGSQGSAGVGIQQFYVGGAQPAQTTVDILWLDLLSGSRYQPKLVPHL